MNILSWFEKASLDPEQEAACLLGSLANIDLTLPPELRMRYESLIREAIQSANSRAINDEEQNTRAAYEKFSEVILAHTIQELKKDFEQAQDASVEEAPWRRRQDWHLSKRDEAKLRVNSQLLAAGLIGKERAVGRLYVGSHLIEVLPGASWEQSVTLRSDRITFGWSAASLTSQTKVSLNVDGAVETVVVGSKTTSRSTFSEEITPNRSQYFSSSSIGIAGSSRTVSKTKNILGVVDNRSVQLIVTDSNWQFSLNLGPESVNRARAFSQRLQMEIESLKNSPDLKNNSDKNLKDVLSRIRELGDLLRDGLITQEEFDALKAELLTGE